MTKTERFIRSVAGSDPCVLASDAIRRYRSMTLQQAWHRATTDELRSLCGFRRSCFRCWCNCETAGDIRKRLPTPPEVVLRAYRRIK